MLDALSIGTRASTRSSAGRSMAAVKSAAYRVLIIDDDPNDRLLLQHAFENAAGDSGTVQAVSSGEEAIAYMVGDGKYADRQRYPFPNLLITDLSMPHGDGLAVLEFMKHNPAWHVVPRVVLTSSDDDDDVKTAYLLGASAYHRKPLSQEKLEAFVHSIVHYWTSCEVPPVDETGRLLMTDSRGKIGERYKKPEGGEKMERPE